MLRSAIQAQRLPIFDAASSRCRNFEQLAWAWASFPVDSRSSVSILPTPTQINLLPRYSRRTARSAPPHQCTTRQRTRGPSVSQA